MHRAHASTAAFRPRVPGWTIIYLHPGALYVPSIAFLICQPRVSVFGFNFRSNWKIASPFPEKSANNYASGPKIQTKICVKCLIEGMLREFTVSDCSMRRCWFSCANIHLQSFQWYHVPQSWLITIISVYFKGAAGVIGTLNLAWRGRIGDQKELTLKC